jgi:hypothetical protein
MAVSRSAHPKSPSQSPTDFYQSKQQGGAHGKASGDHGNKQSSGPMREQINGRKGL